MNWAEAISRSPKGKAKRTTQREGEVVMWIRSYTGDGYYYFRGRFEEANPERLEGYDDWEPVL